MNCCGRGRGGQLPWGIGLLPECGASALPGPGDPTRHFSPGLPLSGEKVWGVGRMWRELLMLLASHKGFGGWAGLLLGKLFLLVLSRRGRGGAIALISGWLV